jgi:glycosyltransferase involved in cell wall biosynthesis
MKISVIVPAYNEQAWIGHTLRRIQRAVDAAGREMFELIVVDNASSDKTAEVAEENGARVVKEQHRGIGRARNKGAAAAIGDVLVFIDADTIVPDKLLIRIREAIAEPAVIGGAVGLAYTTQRKSLAWYLAFERIVGMLAHTARGATQFVWREVFNALGGYDPMLWMSEDIDFYRRLRKYARKNGREVKLIDDIQVEPSTRRFDRTPLSMVIRRTNPRDAWVYRRRRDFWREWYDNPIR